MQSIGLVLCFHQTWPPASGPARLDVAFRRVYLPLIAALDAYPAVRAVVHWSGPLLVWMEAHAPDAFKQVCGLAAQGRIEILGGPWSGALLPALPERDAVGQIQATTRWWKPHPEVRIRGAWLPYTAWDPTVARILGRLGLHYTVLEDTQFHPPVVADGYYLTEREGQALALFVADTRLSALVPEATPKRLLSALAGRAADGVRCVTLTIDGDALGVEDDERAARTLGPDGSIRHLFHELSDNSHWIKLVTFGTVLERMRPTDRAWPGASVSLPVAVAALGGEAGAEFEAIITEMRRHEVVDLVRCAPYLRAGAWEGLLVSHPEINRLHKRMLRASLEVLRLRTTLREGRGEKDPRLVALEEATFALYRGQGGAAYVLGTAIGAQDGAVRAEAWAGLLTAERMISVVLRESDRLRQEQVDYDCDGRAEVLVRTPHLGGIVAPSHGGALVELDAWGLAGNLLNTWTRRAETTHVELARSENLPTLLRVTPVVTREDAEEVTEAELDLRELPPLRVAEPGLADELHYDRHVRASFLDHFFGPEATLQNLRSGRYPEAGDFCGADYQLLQVDESTEGTLQVVLARDGSVNEGAALRLVRVAKRYVFQRDMPVIDVRYEVANRYHEPVRTRFGVELNLNLDSARSDDLCLEIGGERWALHEWGEATEVTEVSLVDRNRGWRLTLNLDQPARLWFFPVESVSASPRGLRRYFQGTCLVVWWPMELWGMERKRYTLSLSLDA